MENYKETNKDWWNQAVAVNAASDFYDVQGFLNGGTSLQETERNLLGDISGKRILHLQCHFGQDSISLARLGASVVGADISDKGIEKARELAAAANQKLTFVCSDIYDLPQNLVGEFDIVFTTYGVIGHLPDMDKWAAVIGHFLKPGGRFVFVEFHPAAWMFDDTFQRIEYRYFKSDPIVESTSGTYADKDAPIQGTRVGWNHGLAEVMMNLIKHGIQIKHFQEYDFSHYNCFPNCEEYEPKKYRLKHLGNKIPLMYSIVGIKSQK